MGRDDQARAGSFHGLSAETRYARATTGLAVFGLAVSTWVVVTERAAPLPDGALSLSLLGLLGACLWAYRRVMG